MKLWLVPLFVWSARIKVSPIQRVIITSLIATSCKIAVVMPLATLNPLQPRKAFVADTLFRLFNAKSPTMLSFGMRSSPPLRQMLTMGSWSMKIALPLLVITVTRLFLIYFSTSSAVELVLINIVSPSCTYCAAYFAMACLYCSLDSCGSSFSTKC